MRYSAFTIIVIYAIGMPITWYQGKHDTLFPLMLIISLIAIYACYKVIKLSSEYLNSVSQRAVDHERLKVKMDEEEELFALSHWVNGRTDEFIMMSVLGAIALVIGIMHKPMLDKIKIESPTPLTNPA